MSAYHGSLLRRIAGLAVLGLTTSGLPLAAQDSSTPPRIQRQTVLLDSQTRLGFEVIGLTDADHLRIRQRFGDGSLDSVLQVFVDGQPTPLLGRVLINVNRIVFEPRFALDGDMAYDVRFDMKSIRADWSGTALQQQFASDTRVPASPQIVAVLPSATELPQNLLKMYIRFSQPMSRGQADRCIRFLDSDGREVADAWLSIPQELWDRPGKQFTVLFDPGRIKRGLARNEQLGLPFQVGQTYTLVIDQQWPSASGLPLAETFRTTFTITGPDRRQPDPATWQITTPPARSRQPVGIQFGESLDGSMLQHAIQIRQGDRLIAGTVKIGEQENQWTLVPDEPWLAGHYVVEIDPRLEDLAGNSIAKPFEIQVDNQEDLSKINRLEFTVD